MISDQAALRFKDGHLVVSTPWGSLASGVILVNGEAVQGDWSKDRDGRFVCRHGVWDLTVVESPESAFSLCVTNAESDRTFLRDVHFARWNPDAFSESLHTGLYREFIFGSIQATAAGVKCVGRKALGLDFVAPSSMVTVYQLEDGDAMLLGILPPVGVALSEFVTRHSEPHYEGVFGFEVRHEFACAVDPGASVQTSPMIVLSGASGVDLLAAYGERWRALLDRKLSKPPVVGWNSWDYYSGAVTRTAMDENITAAQELFGGALKVFAIDEGWEQQWGSWIPNAKFGDLSDFCRHVKAQGLVPGIWTSPLLMNTYHPVFLEHPDWFAERSDGQIQTERLAYGPMAYLDVTKPETLDFVADIFRRLRAAGFEYFKVDFCHCILRAQRFDDPTVGRAALIRRVFETIRAEIGEDAYLLSCGSPYESVIGLVDGVRTTGDIHIYWGHVVKNAANLAAKWWMQGRRWNCDPDFLVVRGPETAEPPYGRRQVVTPVGSELGWIAGREFNEMEARSYALLVHLSGGDVVLGDPLRQLHENGVAMLHKTLSPREPGVPIDLFTSEQDLPRIWISRGETDTLVGLFNWLDKPARIDFDPDAYGLSGMPVDFWTNQPVAGIPDRMARRSSMALRYV